MNKVHSFLLIMLLILGAGCFVLKHYYTFPALSGSPSASVSEETSSPETWEPASSGSSVSPACSYIVNTSSKIFHLPSCPSTGQMKEQNKQYVTETRDELLALGYRPCGSCKP